MSSEINSSIINIQLDGYLCDFIRGYIDPRSDKTKPVRIDKYSFIGEMLYSLLETVPTECIYRPNFSGNKPIISLEIYRLGRAPEKNPIYYYYFPVDKRKLFTKFIKNFFDELLISCIEMIRAETEKEFKILIEQFCDKYNIDFGLYYETLKKKYYRDRQEKLHRSLSH